MYVNCGSTVTNHFSLTFPESSSSKPAISVAYARKEKMLKTSTIQLKSVKEVKAIHTGARET